MKRKIVASFVIASLLSINSSMTSVHGSEIFGGLIDKFGEAKDFVTDTAGNISEGASNIADSAGKELTEAGNKIAEGMKNAGSSMAEGAEKVGSVVAEGAKKAGAAVSENTGNVGSVIAEGATTVGTIAVYGASKAGVAIAEGATAAGTAIAEGASKARTTIAENATAAGTAIAQGASVAGTAVTEGATIAGAAIAEGASVAGTVIQKGVTAAGSAALEFVGPEMLITVPEVFDPTEALPQKLTVSGIARQDVLNYLLSHNSIAEDRNNVMDSLLAKTMETRMSIPSSYYPTAEESVEAIFKNAAEDTVSGFIQNGIEFSSEQVDEAIDILEHLISTGAVPGLSDPKAALSIVKRGRYTYEQVKNLAKASSVSGLEYDPASGSVRSLGETTVSTAITFARSIWNGDSLDEALKNAFTGELAENGLNFAGDFLMKKVQNPDFYHSLIPATDGFIQMIGPKTTAAVVNIFRDEGSKIYGAAAMKHAGKLIRTGTVKTAAAAAGAVLEGAPVVKDFYDQKISPVQFGKNMATVGGSVAGGLIGGPVGAVAGSVAVDKALDYVIDDDAKVMAPVIQREYQRLAYDYLLTEDEAKFITEIINYSLSDDVIKEMYSSKNRSAYAQSFLRPIIEEQLKWRSEIS